MLVGMAGSETESVVFAGSFILSLNSPEGVVVQSVVMVP
jgi:hypothetical protein